MGNSNKVCPGCGRKMKQQFIGLQHCKCGISWKKNTGFFERMPNMVFYLDGKKPAKSIDWKKIYPIVEGKYEIVK